MRKKYGFLKIILLVVFFCFIFTTFTCSAEEENIYNFDIDSLIETLPNEVIDLLPEGIDELSQSPEKIVKLFGSEYILDLSAGLFKSALSSSIKTFAFVAAVILISTMLSSVGNAFLPSGTGIQVWSLAGSLCIGCCAYSMIWSHVESVIAFSENISSFMKSLALAISGVYLSGGEVGSAGTHSAWIFSAVAVTEEMCGKILLPVMQISFSATLASSTLSGVNISRLVQMIRNAFTSILVFFMTVISVILAFQTIIAHSSDTLAMRSVRYAISHSVPIIGGLVSDSARTLSTSFSLMKNSIGFIGIGVIILLSLYPLVGLIASKYSLQLASSFSSMICEDKSTLFLDESVKMINFLIAIVILLDVAFIFCMSVFALLPASGA